MQMRKNISTGVKGFNSIINSDSSKTQSKEERFLMSIIYSIQLIHNELLENPNNEDYRLSVGEIYDLQEAVFQKDYTLSPMRLVSKKEQKDRHDIFEAEGSYYFLRGINTDNYILRRFPIEVPIDLLNSNLFINSRIVSPKNIRYPYEEKRNHYIKSSIEDNLFIAAFTLALILYLQENPYFRKTSYYNYYSTEQEMLDAYKIKESLDKEKNMIVELDKMKWIYSRSRVIEKMAPFVNSDKYLMSIIDSMVNLPIIDKVGLDISIKERGSPMIPLLDDVLFNIFLTDVDKKMEDRFPNLEFCRFQDEMIISLEKYKSLSDQNLLMVSLKDIINDCFL